MQIGTIICDMHDGFSGIKATKHVVIETDRSFEMLQSLCESKGIEAPHNKLAIVTGESRSGDLQAAYSFDGVRFGVIEFEVE